MSLLPDAKFFQVNLKFTGAGVPTGAETTFGIATVSEQGIEEMAENMDDILDNVNLHDLCTSDVTLASFMLKQGPNDVGPFLEIPRNETGTASGDTGYAGASLLIQKRTGIGGRQNRGRMYFPGIAESAIETGGIVESGYLTSAQTVFDDLLAQLLSTSHPNAFASPMVVLHQSSSAQPPEVLTLVVSNTIATQRRRQRR